MPVDSVLEAARIGMNYERLRLDAASRNIAGANAPIAPGKSATLWGVEGGDFSNMLVAHNLANDATSSEMSIRERDAAAREVYDPGHPMADATGMVRYPAVDLVQEMTTLMTASRGYEANVRSFNFLRGMLLRAIEIGAK
jgi:flagellar basal-body rod protein FlgC